MNLAVRTRSLEKAELSYVVYWIKSSFYRKYFK